jgi:hypothetical protein
MRTLRAMTVAAASTLVFAGGMAAPAAAQTTTIQDGLVNVSVGDVTILEDVNIAVAAEVAAQICGVDVGPVAVLGDAVDRSGDTRTVCQSEQGPVRIEQN